jgi:hypothetical protein
MRLRHGRDHRQNHLRRMTRLVIDRVVGGHHPPIIAEGVSGIRVNVEPWIIATRNVDPDAMTLLEDIGVGIERDRDRDDVARIQGRGLVIEPVAVPRP